MWIWLRGLFGGGKWERVVLAGAIRGRWDGPTKRPRQDNKDQAGPSRYCKIPKRNTPEGIDEQMLKEDNCEFSQPQAPCRALQPNSSNRNSMNRELVRLADQEIWEQCKLNSRKHHPAVVVAVSVNGVTVYTAAFGFSDIENRVPATTDFKFKVASVSKLFATHAFIRSMHDHWRAGMTVAEKKRYNHSEMEWMKWATIHDFIGTFPESFYLWTSKTKHGNRSWYKWNIYPPKDDGPSCSCKERLESNPEFEESGEYSEGAQNSSEPLNYTIPAIAVLCHTVGLSHYMNKVNYEGNYLRFTSSSAVYDYMAREGKYQFLYKNYPGKYDKLQDGGGQVESEKYTIANSYTSFGTNLAGAMLERMQSLSYDKYTMKLICEMGMIDTLFIDTDDGDPAIMDYKTGYIKETDEINIRRIDALESVDSCEEPVDNEMKDEEEEEEETSEEEENWRNCKRHSSSGRRDGLINEYQRDYSSFLPSEGVVSTVEDLVKFGNIYARMYRHPEREDSPLPTNRVHDDLFALFSKESSVPSGIGWELHESTMQQQQPQGAWNCPQENKWRFDALHSGQTVSGNSMLRVHFWDERARRLANYHPELAWWGPASDEAWKRMEPLEFNKVPPEVRQQHKDEFIRHWRRSMLSRSAEEATRERDFVESRRSEERARRDQIDRGEIEPWQLTRPVSHTHQTYDDFYYDDDEEPCSSNTLKKDNVASDGKLRNTVVVAMLSQECSKSLLHHLSKWLAQHFEGYQLELDEPGAGPEPEPDFADDDFDLDLF